MKPGDIIRKHVYPDNVGGKTAYEFVACDGTTWFNIHPDDRLDIPSGTECQGIILATMHEPEARTETDEILPARDFILLLSQRGICWYKWDEVVPFEVLT